MKVNRKKTTYVREFYEFFFRMNNIGKENPLTNNEIKLASIVSEKGPDFYIGRKKKPLVQEMGLSTSNAIYKLIDGLLEKGVFVKDEDGFIHLHPFMKNMQKSIEQSLKAKDIATVDFNYTITITTEDD